MRLRLRIAYFTAALAVAITAWPTAYVLNGPKWAIRTVDYYINPANNDVSAAAAEAAIQVGAAAWGSQSNADFRFYYVGRTSATTVGNNGKNEVFFRNVSAGSVVAETYWWADASNRLIDADILIYDGGILFFTGSSGCVGGLYLEDVTAHEFGHALGLGHSSDPTATMYPSATWCANDWRFLSSDDLAGVEALYPPSGGGTHNTAPSLTISAPANNTTVASGTSVTFTASATDQQDGNLTSRISWSSNLTGQFGVGGTISSVLPAGTHVVTATVSDNGGLTTAKQVTVTVTVTVGGGTSPDQTRLPPASQIVDASGSIWTIAGMSILRNGQQTGGLGTIITWCGGQIHVMGVDNQWWRWTGGGWSPVGTTDPCGGAAPAPPPPQGTSPDGTRLPPASQIVDASGGTWTIAGVSILRNGQQTGGLGTIITWCGGQIHVMGVDNQWWRWIGGGWSPVGTTDPCGGAAPAPPSGTSPDGARLPPASQIVDASGATWTIAGVSILRNGQQTGGWGTIITWCGGQIRVLGVDNQWWRWTGGGWSPVGTIDPCGGT